MIAGIILAAGKGTRFKSDGINKTASTIEEKPLVAYGVELYNGIVDTTYVVVGAYSQSVRSALQAFKVSYIEQNEQLGTGHAAKVATEFITNQQSEPELVLVGYGDHLMFYTQQIVRDMIATHKDRNAAITLVTADLQDPNKFKWGRIIRSKNGTVERIIEQKEASEKERAITESNAGFYVFDFHFLKENVAKLQKSPVAGEYYITDFIEIAVKKNFIVIPFSVDFRFVGPDVNTHEQLEETQQFLTNK